MSVGTLTPQSDNEFPADAIPVGSQKTQQRTQQVPVEIIKSILVDVEALQNPDLNASIVILHQHIIDEQENVNFDWAPSCNDLCKKVMTVATKNRDENSSAIISQLQPLLRKPLQQILIELRENPTFKDLSAQSIPKNDSEAFHLCGAFDKLIRKLSPYYESMKGDTLHAEVMRNLTPVAEAIYSLYLNGNSAVSNTAKQSIKLLARKGLIPEQHKKALFQFVDKRQPHYFYFSDECTRLTDFFTASQNNISTQMQYPFLNRCIDILRLLSNLVPNKDSYEMESTDYFPAACLKVSENPINLPQRLSDLIDSIDDQINTYQSKNSEYDNTEIIHQMLHSYQAMLPSIKEKIMALTDFSETRNQQRYLIEISNMKSILSLLQTCKIRRSLILMREIHKDCIPQKMQLALHNQLRKTDFEFEKTLADFARTFGDTDVTLPAYKIHGYASLYHNGFLRLLPMLPLQTRDFFEHRIAMIFQGYQDPAFLLDCMRVDMPLDQMQRYMNLLNLANIDLQKLLLHDEQGEAPASIALAKRDETLLLFLQNNGLNMQRVTLWGGSILHIAVEADLPVLIDYCIDFSKKYNPIPEDQDYFGTNILHLGITNHCAKAIKHIQNHHSELFHRLAQQTDLFGYKPLDYAYFYKAKWFFKNFCNKTMLSSILTSEQYGNQPTKRHQKILLQKYSDYITVKSAKEGIPRDLWNIKGLCNGINFLKGFYDALEPDGWNIRFDLFVSWDGSIEALEESGPTFANDESYETLGEFFENFLNGLTLFQLTVDARSRQPLIFPSETISLSQLNRPSQLDIIARENPNLSLENFELSTIKKLTYVKLLEELTILTQKEVGTTIEIGGGNHASRFDVLEGGFKYYDCNLEYDVPKITSVEELAYIIYTTKYAVNRKIEKGKIEFLTCSYMLVNSEDES